MSEPSPEAVSAPPMLPKFQRDVKALSEKVLGNYEKMIVECVKRHVQVTKLEAKVQELEKDKERLPAMLGQAIYNALEDGRYRNPSELARIIRHTFELDSANRAAMSEEPSNE